MEMYRKWLKWVAAPMILSLILAGCNGSGNENVSKTAASSSASNGKPATWIADRKIKGLVFMGTDDYTEDMNAEVKQKIKDLTGIDFEIQIMKANRSIEGLTAGLASGDLPDFIAFYLNNSGRPEMKLVLKAARDGMFTDLTPLMKDTKVYSKYLQNDYLPTDTKNSVMFRPEFKGSSYFVHMNIPRDGGYLTRKYVGGPYIRKDIAEALKIDPSQIKTTDQLYKLAQQIKEGNFKDKNGKNVYPIGPGYWGTGNNKDYSILFSDLMWGSDDQRINQDANGNILHEAETDFAMKKVEYMQKLFKEKLINTEMFTMDESRATENVLNGSFAIIGDMHNYQDFNQDGHFVPLGPLNKVNGPYQMQVDYKSGSSAWAIPSKTKNPQDIVKFADFLASREGKLLWRYGIEGRDYTLDAKGNPIVKQSVLDLKKNSPNEAKKLGFAGVGNNWGELLGSTDIKNEADFGEAEYGDSVSPANSAGALAIAKMWNWDEKRANAKIVDGYTPLAFMGEFKNVTALQAALDNYNVNLVKAYYSKDLTEAKKILDSSLQQLKNAGVDDYLKLLSEKNADPKTKIKF